MQYSDIHNYLSTTKSCVDVSGAPAAAEAAAPAGGCHCICNTL